MGVLEEMKTMLKGIKADFAKVSSPLGFVHFVVNGFFTEVQKWFGPAPCIWNFMYWACDYRQKMLDPSQQARYTRIKEILVAHCPKKADVLDVGCGTANGLSLWREADLGSYSGIDIAEAAIAEAADSWGQQQDVPTCFEAVSMQDYDSKGRAFDAVIFNESLYFVTRVSEAADMVRKALSLLKVGGLLIISMSETHHAEKVWVALDFLPAPVCKGQVASPHGNTWRVGAFEKKEVSVASQ